MHRISSECGVIVMFRCVYEVQEPFNFWILVLNLLCYFNSQLRTKDHSGNMAMAFDLKFSMWRKIKPVFLSPVEHDVQWLSSGENQRKKWWGTGGCGQWNRPLAFASWCWWLRTKLSPHLPQMLGNKGAAFFNYPYIKLSKCLAKDLQLKKAQKITVIENFQM